MIFPNIPNKIKCGDTVMARTASIFGTPSETRNEVIWVEGRWAILSLGHVYTAIVKLHKYWREVSTYNGAMIDLNSIEKLEKEYANWLTEKNIECITKSDDRYEKLIKNVKVDSKIKLIDIWLPNKFGEEEITDEHYQSGDILTVSDIDWKNRILYCKELMGKYFDSVNFSCAELQ